MAYFFSGQSHTFNEYLLVPGYSSSECIPDNVSLRTPLTRFRAGEEPALSLNVPMVSAVMQSVSGDRLAVALAQEGGVSFLYGSQSIEDEAAMVARVKSYKAGFVRSDSNISPDATLSDILALREQTGHSTVAVTEDGTADGRLVGIVTSRDYRVSRMVPETPVREFMTPREKMITAPDGTSLKEANNIIWGVQRESELDQFLQCVLSCSARTMTSTSRNRTNCSTVRSATSSARASTPATMPSACPRWSTPVWTCS